MGNVSLWVVVLLVLLSGAVAAVGDWLGRKLGKKRLRIGKLRPKHTAIVTTAVAGMLITLSTIIVLSLTSEQVRIWLTEGTDVQRQLKETKNQLTSTQGDLDAGKRQLTETNKQLEEQKSKLAEEQAKLAAATKDANDMRAEAARLKSQVASVQEQVKTMSASLSTLRAEYAKVERDLKVASDNIEIYSQRQIELSDQNRLLLESNDKLEKDIDALNGQIRTLNQQVLDAQAAQKSATQAFEVERQRIETERGKALADLATATSDLEAARRELTLTRNAALNLADSSRRARLNPLIYNRGDELARLSVRSGLTQTEARSLLLGVIELASRDAEELGAAADPTGMFATFQQLPDTSVDAQFGKALQAMIAKEGEQLVVVRAVYNFFRGDTVAIDVDVVPNKVVYNQGDFIIETRIDGRLGVQRATEALVGFMGNELRQRVIRDGIVPATGRPTEIGSVSQEEIQRIIGDIVATGRTITVRFHAGQLTKAGDHLELDIRLR